MNKQEETSSKTAILVLGMHRSGTSAITRVLSLVGTALPLRCMGAAEGNETGHWEPDYLVQFNEKFLSSFGLAWNDWYPLNMADLTPEREEEARREIAEHIAQDYGDEPLIIVKDPRICRFADFFMTVMKDLGYDIRILLPFRNPLEVMRSLERRSRFWPTTHTRQDAALLWLIHVLEGEIATRHIPRSIISYDAVLRDWKQTVAKIGADAQIDFPLSAEDAEAEVGDFLKDSLKHNSQTSSEVGIDPVTRGWLNRTYKALLQLEETPELAEALEALDTVRHELANSMPFLETASREERQAKIALSDVQSDLSLTRNELVALRETHEKTAELLRATEAARNHELDLLAASRTERNAYEAALVSAHKVVEDLQEAVHIRIDEVVGLNAAMKKSDHLIEELRKELQMSREGEVNLVQSIAQVGKQLAGKEKQLKSARDELARANSEHEARAAEDQQRMESLRQQGFDLHAKLHASQKKLTELEATSARAMQRLQEDLSRQTAEQKSILSRQAAEIDDLKHQLFLTREAFQNTVSWKITGPLRGIANGSAEVGRAAKKLFRVSSGSGNARQMKPSEQVLSAKIEHIESLPTLDAALARQDAAVATKAQLSTGELKKLLGRQLAKSPAGLAVAVTASRTGNQGETADLFPVEERELFQKGGTLYLELRPARPLPVLASAEAPEAFIFEILANGSRIGTATTETVNGALTGALAESSGNQGNTPLIIHSLEGHAPEAIELIMAAIEFSQKLFWLHDHFTLCQNPKLLRNDLTYCAAPATDSNSCNVCYYGAGRAEHMKRIDTLLDREDLTVIAPTQPALSFWQERAGATAPNTAVIPYLDITASETASRISQPGSVVKLAFVGPARKEEGWPAFSALAAMFAKDKRYQFLQIGGQDARSRGIQHVPLHVFNPPSLTAALKENGVDAVVLWPDYSGVVSLPLYAARAAGCVLVTASHLPAGCETSPGLRSCASPDELATKLKTGAFRDDVVKLRSASSETGTATFSTLSKHFLG
ncbi:hypothetical protein [Roseibium suaedae]|uniref:Glycosyltransferase n=1 Tax=Roseibium suaedae TaxID=735517 RepID=A0A1M7P753_9HYPH|nr:hypothetical protein [Roseibium suaedae]SHN12531.1 hypothetical protein SAMN05444272_4166 [Roseibium suaedae]